MHTIDAPVACNWAYLTYVCFVVVVHDVEGRHACTGVGYECRGGGVGEKCRRASRLFLSLSLTVSSSSSSSLESASSHCCSPPLSPLLSSPSNPAVSSPMVGWFVRVSLVYGSSLSAVAVRRSLFLPLSTLQPVSGEAFLPPSPFSTLHLWYVRLLP